MKTFKIYFFLSFALVFAFASQSFAQARLQVIHNSADAAASVVDVWLNDSKLIENFAFRTASPFIDAPAGVPFTVSVQPPGSTSASNPLWSQSYTLASGGTYVLVANGLVVDQGYNPFKPFDIYVMAEGREAAVNPNSTDVLVFHGSTDAPVVDVVEIGVGAGTIIDNFAYGSFAGYLSLPVADYVLAVRDETGTVTVAAFAAPLQTLQLGGQALTVVASGFLNPNVNNNGAPFGLYVALASGGDLIPLPVVTSVEEQKSFNILEMFPNPAKESLNLSIDLNRESRANVEIYNMVGARVLHGDYGNLGSGLSQISIPVNQLPEGMYMVKVTAGKQQQTQKLLINR